ncbi:MAG: ComEC/Rec2 family competence protein, partial [Candidatus Doudnabacteria bacterium]|nr:ComEC/Rec2 family competence protein [Candidatus Doudnabacteria bacterium]
WVVDTVHERMPGENGDVLLGMLIGQKRGLPAEALDDFIRTGTSHILAVSGFNVSIFIIWLSGLAAWVGRRRQLIISAVAVVCFAGISGFSAAVIRASCMGLLLLVSFGQGRLYIPAAAVILAAAGMVFQNPRLLYWDVGFQLSVVATLGIVWGMDVVGRLKEWFPRAGMLLQLVGVTVCALVATIPLSVWHFGQLSTVAVVANLLVLPFVEIIMALGLLALVPVIGMGFAYVCGLALTAMRWIVGVLAEVPFASVSASLSGSWAVVVLALVLGLLYLGSEDGERIRSYVTTMRRVWYNLPRLAEKAVKKYQ